MFDFLCLFYGVLLGFMLEYVNNVFILNNKRNSTQHKTMEYLRV